MNNSNRKLQVVRLLASVVLPFFVFVFAVVIRARSRPVDEQPVLMRLLLPESTVCMGTKAVHSEIELRNVGTRPIRLGMAGIGSGVHFQAYGGRGDPPQGTIFRSLDNTGDAWPKAEMQKIVTLQGNESYRSGGEILLDAKFFDEPGIYKVSIDFSGRFKLPPDGGSKTDVFGGEITSNWVFFEVQDCDNK
jgi:hypothetical protein